MKLKVVDKIANTVLYIVTGINFVILASLLGYILFKGVPHISWHFHSSPATSFEAGGGIGITLLHSFYLLVLAMLIYTPISLGAGIYHCEYAQKNWLTDVIRTSIEISSSLPSVVVGLFGFLIFVLTLQFGFSILSGALALTVLHLPLLTRNVEDTLRGVGFEQREAGLALGSSRWETVLHVDFPEALPGIITGMISGAGRVFGEAAASIYTAGTSAPALDYSHWNPEYIASPSNPFRPAETLAVHIWKIHSEGITPDAVAVSAGECAVLVIAVLVLHVGARVRCNRSFKKMTAA